MRVFCFFTLKRVRECAIACSCYRHTKTSEKEIAPQRFKRLRGHTNTKRNKLGSEAVTKFKILHTIRKLFEYF